MSRALSLNPQLFGKPSFVPLSPTNVARGTHGHAGGALLDDRRIVVPWPLQELGGHRPPCAAGRAQPLTETSIFESAHQTQSIGRDFLRSGSLSRDPRAAGDVACTAAADVHGKAAPQGSGSTFSRDGGGARLGYAVWMLLTATLPLRRSSAVSKETF